MQRSRFHRHACSWCLMVMTVFVVATILGIATPANRAYAEEPVATDAGSTEQGLSAEELSAQAAAASLVEDLQLQESFVTSDAAGRTTPPTAGSRWYYTDENPYYRYRSWGLAPCGEAYDGSYTVGNCTWYAWGRAAEVLGYAPDLDNSDPEGMWNYVLRTGSYETSSTPRANSIAVGYTAYGSGHVSYVEEVKGGKALVSESFYGERDYWPGFENVNFRCGVDVSYSIDYLLGYIYLPTSGEPAPEPEPESESLFPDVPASHWAYKVVEQAARLGLIAGYSNGYFGPEDNVTRGQVATILWRMAGKPTVGKGAKTFPDVATNSYYYKAVGWASSAGVVNGYGNGTFCPDKNVTREELAVMLANYARKVAGKSVRGSSDDYAAMGDADSVSGFATVAMGWCFRNKVLSGADGMALPQGQATRAEAAKMLVRVYRLTK